MSDRRFAVQQAFQPASPEEPGGRLKTCPTSVARPAAALAASMVLVVSAAFVRPAARPTDAAVTIKLVDAATGAALPGVIRVRRTGDESLVEPGGLVARGWGLDAKAVISQWFVLPSPRAVALPAEKLTIEALAGLEHARGAVELDLARDSVREIRMPLLRFSNVRTSRWFSANTHLHLRNLSRAESDRYLREIPATDGLDVLFISHLERADDDRTYITNEYAPGRRKELDSGGVRVSQGEEHRHNFGPQAEGYGHVMLLGIRELVQPVSIGFGISKKHPDSPPLRAGIASAREQGGTAIWCHNNWGYEDVPNWLAGRLDAQNIFDGGAHGGYAESFYRYLNAGLHVPFSTGTDWFMYDFSRVYALVRDEPTPENWLAALRAGRSFITNGPLLTLEVRRVKRADGEGRDAGAPAAGPGDSIALAGRDELQIVARARGRLDFGQLEIVENGAVVESAAARAADGYYEVALDIRRPNTEPCWLAARVNTTAKNEYRQAIFGHTSPVYVSVAGRGVRQPDALRSLLEEVRSSRGVIADKARFDNDAERDAVLGGYDRAIEELQTRLAE